MDGKEKEIFVNVFYNFAYHSLTLRLFDIRCCAYFCEFLHLLLFSGSFLMLSLAQDEVKEEVEKI